MESLGAAASIVAIVEISAKIAATCIQYSRDVKNAGNEISRLQAEILSLKVTASNASELLKGPHAAKLMASQQLTNALEQAVLQLEQLENKLCPSKSRKVMSRVGLRALKWPFQSQEISKIVQNMATCTQTITMSLQIDQTSILLGMDGKITGMDQKSVLDKLPNALGASFDSRASDGERQRTCLPNTRVDLLKVVEAWMDDPKAKPMFWLNGMAGMGKSTISQTVASSLAERQRLGASFFFKRGETDRSDASKFLTTITSQLISYIPSLARHVKEAVDANPMLHNKTLREQFEKLILDPFDKIRGSPYEDVSFIVVVDALDECEHEDEVKMMVHLFSRAKGMFSPKLKFLVTSRPELPVRLGFDGVAGTFENITLSGISTHVITHDISVFLKHELECVKQDYNCTVSAERRLSPDWPGPTRTQILVQMAVPLFIFAATLCRFLRQRGFGGPEHQLQQILYFKSARRAAASDLTSKLERTYQPVLNQQLTDLSVSEAKKAITQFRQIVGTIVSLATPVSVTTLGYLISLPRDIIGDRLDMLHSVLAVPKDFTSPVRLLHLSFRDFLVNPEQKDANPFWVNEEKVHYRLAMGCLAILRQHLRYDLCNLQAPATQRKSVVANQINRCLPPEVQYACLHWTHHQRQAGASSDLLHNVYDFLLRHFLHWIEALSLMGKAYDILDLLEVQTANGFSPRRDGLAAFVEDAERFIRHNLTIIDSSPLQIYSSALIFTPQRSLMRKTFEHSIPGWIELKPNTETDWDRCLQMLEGHDQSVTSVAFSHDSTLLASASDDKTIRIWRTLTGECTRNLIGHDKAVVSVVFSHDSTLVASASWDDTVRIWRIDTGESIRTLNGHQNWVSAVAFSHDSMFVASASYDNSVRIWRTDTGICSLELTGHGNSANYVAFSHDSTSIASVSDDRSIRIWRTDTGECVHRLEGHSLSITSVAFSHDSRFIVSGSHDKTVRIWRTLSGECVQELEGHSLSVTSVAFSHDSTLVASASYDGTLRISQASTGNCLQELKGHSDKVRSVSLSHNTARVASASNDNTIRIWSTEARFRTPKFQCHEHLVTAMALSHDSSLVASGSHDKMVRIWQTNTGECIGRLEGHTGSISSITFSPDSRLVASASWDQSVRIWEVDTRDCVQELKGHRKAVRSVVFSNDRAFVASASYDMTVRIWRVDTGECTQKLKGHSRSVGSVVFSHDSALVASGSHDKTIRVWRTDNGECTHELKGHGDWVCSVAFWNDSKILASASDDNTIRLWLVDTGLCTLVADVRAGLSASLALGGTQLRPDRGGILTLYSVAAKQFCSLTNAEAQSSLIPGFKIGTSRDQHWMTWETKDVLWLPVECLPSCSAVRGNTFAFGCSSGKVYILRFRDPGNF